MVEGRRYGRRYEVWWKVGGMVEGMRYGGR